jgi:hypothetical protein
MFRLTRNLDTLTAEQRQKLSLLDLFDWDISRACVEWTTYVSQRDARGEDAAPTRKDDSDA